MARIRTIKPHFFKSYDVAQLSYRARITWIGLWTYVDDSGRGRDDARIIKGELWPLEDSVTWQEVEKDLTELSLSAHVVRYTVENRQYLCIPTWHEHQVISRPTESRLPSEKEGLIRDFSELTEDSLKTQGVITAGKGKGTGNREGEEEMEVHVATATKQPSQSEIQFESFWSIWPKRIAKADARRAWDKSIKKATPDIIIHAATQYANSPYKPERQFIPLPATWLNGERWADDLPQAPDVVTKAQKNLSTVDYFQAVEQLAVEA